jgi:hypothetical protein
MTEAVACWRCGAELPYRRGVPRSAECESCGADLHVCRACRYYDPGVSQACREPVAEPVADKERANFCGYFELAGGAHASRDDAEARRAEAELASLFGLETSPGPREPRSEAERSREELERLFGLRDS